MNATTLSTSRHCRIHEPLPCNGSYPSVVAVASTFLVDIMTTTTILWKVAAVIEWWPPCGSYLWEYAFYGISRGAGGRDRRLWTCLRHLRVRHGELCIMSVLHSSIPDSCQDRCWDEFEVAHFGESTVDALSRHRVRKLLQPIGGTECASSPFGRFFGVYQTMSDTTQVLYTADLQECNTMIEITVMNTMSITRMTMGMMAITATTTFSFPIRLLG